MLGAWFYADRFSRRLRAVGTAAGRIQGGDVLARLPSGKGDGELARMCGALNRLVDDLREKKPRP
jgi:nitrogen fixation/metabolism regulation signal transduction histidine kinase